MLYATRATRGYWNHKILPRSKVQGSGFHGNEKRRSPWKSCKLSEISYKKALDGKHKAFRHLFGDFSQSYTDLPRLFLAIEQANPRFVVIWKTTSHSVPNNETFQRVFWAFKPSIEGFANCRPVLSIDGAHLYGKYKGTLLIAMGCDGNNQLFPLAFAITEGENIDSWGWFLACIRRRYLLYVFIVNFRCN